MKPQRLYIIMCILSLFFLTNCRDEEAVQSAEGKRSVTVSLGIAMSRVASEGTPETTYGAASNMKVWIFDENGDPIEGGYANVDNPPFSVEDLQGKLIETVTMDFDVTDATELQLRVLLNSDKVDVYSGETALTLGATTTMNELDYATFKLKADASLGDNTVPMYGKSDDNIVLDNKRNYDISIDVERCVGKLELFFTKENANSELKINSIKLEHVPDKGYLVAPTSYDLTYESSIDLLPENKGINIDAVLTTDQASTTGNFSGIYEQDNTTFQRLELERSYLLENPKGDTWTALDANTDYVYPEENNITDTDTRYMMTVNYTLGSASAVDKVVYLPKIVRNEWNKIFARVKDDGKVTIQYLALPWDEEESQIGWDPVINDGGNAPMTAWRLYRVPGTTDDDYNSHKKGSMEINPDHEDATNGDEEATFCYVLYPRYDNKKDDEGHALHQGFEDRPSYAGFYFKLTQPEGAIWEAYLTNPIDFRFGTGQYDIDGDQIADRFCVTTGRARDKAYQIQVTARNKWTEPEFVQQEDGTYTTINTDWGNKIEADGSCKDIHTDLYIRISLDGGSTWNYLDINKRDRAKDPDDPTSPYLTHTYWGWEVQDGETNYRRFAGGDKYIRIWQLKATYGAGFDKLITELDNTWAIKQYWKPIDYNE